MEMPRDFEQAKPGAALKRAKRAVLRVGAGRGFVVEHRNYLGHIERIVVTAAQCLPHFPPAHPAAYTEEITYRALLGPLGGKRTVWAECLFVELMADIAVLGHPDHPDLTDQADAYDRLLGGMEALRVADAPAQGEELRAYGDMKIRRPTPGNGSAYVLSLEDRWLAGTVSHYGKWLSFEPGNLIKGGMSGSPILSATGDAIGVISTNHVGPALTEGFSAHLLRSLIRPA
jgi:hypothetical protein